MIPSAHMSTFAVGFYILSTSGDLYAGVVSLPKVV